MRIRDLDETPWRELPYLDAGRRGLIETRRLPVLRATATGLPRGLDALVVASDLQGREVPAARPGGVPCPAPGRQWPRLLGEALADALDGWARVGALPTRDRTAVVVAGDLWVDEACAERGGYGDVWPAWEALKGERRWIAGVAGNHDDTTRFRQARGVHLLDGELATLDGLRVGGVGGIPGRSGRPQRKAPDTFVDMTLAVLARRPDVLVLHPSPLLPGSRKGEELVTDALEAADAGALVVCGHVHWDRPLAALGPHQVLNVDARVVLIERA